MRILHTSDWHLGKVLKGQSRLPEQRAVMREMTEIARREKPDLVIVAGDLFETSAPSALAEGLLYDTLSALRSTGADVIAIAGNHDNGPAIDALRSWAEAAGIVVRGKIGTAKDHLVTGTTRDGEPWRCAALPFVSQRYAVRATEMFELTAAEADQSYADHVRRLFAALTGGFDNSAVNLVTGHLTVYGSKLGKTEREAHTVASYNIPATIFPPSTHYVALGHIHKRQRIDGPCPIRYSGGPITVDFGEEDAVPGVLLVDVTVSTPAKVRHVPLTSAVKLRTVRGDLDGLKKDRERIVKIDGDALLRVYIKEKPRAGLREEVQELFPNAIEVRIDPVIFDNESGKSTARRAGRSPRELFGDYLTDSGHDDEKVTELFDRLYDEASSEGTAA
ncbi:exonuclease SbcCD subunit D [Phytomonospora endophytica]|uniref:Nuclease SbcCD subunit D n=1 Tax=Phytomonospora endophytica TaxID=714109 RepID=A0A841FJ49_9ACTN|nr:exonuclease SbcCD subunit D [Phytomonospora endophytica]MBB6034973.1 exonuclease SbcD [Phytomonospora endophytica]GIG71414.1 nuclease SbcCD subunit D [Phytomonospora endophytica]